jgi:hypothetical protein
MDEFDNTLRCKTDDPVDDLGQWNVSTNSEVMFERKGNDRFNILAAIEEVSSFTMIPALAHCCRRRACRNCSPPLKPRNRAA